jgi:uncharacterized RDD family membrane protein YckC
MDVLDQPDFKTPDQFTTASDGDRIGAYIIDIILVIFLSIFPLIGWIFGISYLLLRDALPFLDGQSLGKKVMKTRAVTEDGQPLTNNWGPALVRNVVLFIPLFPIVELIVLLNNPRKQRLGDQWAKTRVVKVS